MIKKTLRLSVFALKKTPTWVPSHAAGLEGAAELLHEALGVGGGGAIAGLADLRETGTTLVVDDPLAGDAVAEGDRSAGEGAGDEGDLVDFDGHTARTGRRQVVGP